MARRPPDPVGLQQPPPFPSSHAKCGGGHQGAQHCLCEPHCPTQPAARPRSFLRIPPTSLSLCPCSETLPVEYLGGKPLCMNQYYQILSSCRVPGPKQDLVTKFSRTKKPPMHITVVHNYQVGDPPAAVQPPHGCRKKQGRAQSQLPQHTCPCALGTGRPWTSSLHWVSRQAPTLGRPARVRAWSARGEQCRDLLPFLALGLTPSPQLGWEVTAACLRPPQNPFSPPACARTVF